MSATTRFQQVTIWIIAVVMVVGTIGSFFVYILSNDNQKADQARLQQIYSEYQAKVDAQNKQLSDTYYAELESYAARVGTFDAASVATLTTEDLKPGDGEALTKDSAFTAYYIGWNPSGVVFDSSLDSGKLKAPFSVTPGYVISGWSEGVEGMKVGGVRLLTIPADKAYGAQGSGANIPPNTPLRFVIFVIPAPESIPYPPELLQTT